MFITEEKVWTSHQGFESVSSTLRFYSCGSLLAARQLPQVRQSRILSKGCSLLCRYLIAGIIVSTSTSWSSVRHLTKEPYYSSAITHITRVKTLSDGFLERGAAHSRSVRHEIWSSCQMLFYMCCASTKQMSCCWHCFTMLWLKSDQQ